MQAVMKELGVRVVYVRWVELCGVGCGGEVSNVDVLGHGKKGGVAADFHSSCCCKNREKKRGELRSWGCGSRKQRYN
jgi:hypothetical protein